MSEPLCFFFSPPPRTQPLLGILTRYVLGDALSRGWAFISADYRLLIPSTGHEILRDVKSLFAFLADTDGGLNKELKALGCPHQIDPNRLFVGGSCAGAYPAFLAALFAQPKPKGYFSLYGVGGDLLSEFYLPLLKLSSSQENGGEGGLPPQESPVLSIDEIVAHAPELRKFLAPSSEDVRAMRSVADVPASLAPRVIVSGFRTPSSPSSVLSRSNSSTGSLSESAGTLVTTDLIPGTNIPGHRARIGGALRNALHHSGKYLDYLVGIPDLSAQLSQMQDYEDRCRFVAQSERCRYLFPQIWVDRDFPPSIVVHGDADGVVSIGESRRFVEQLKECGVEVVFLVAEGKGHQFEERASPEVYLHYVKPVVEFLRRFA